MTSHDVVNHVRRALGERRVGHAGTLDPAASGVMVVGVGQDTRLMGLLTAERKRYTAGIIFGCETDTNDADGAPTVAARSPSAWAARTWPAVFSPALWASRTRCLLLFRHIRGRAALLRACARG